MNIRNLIIFVMLLNLINTLALMYTYKNFYFLFGLLLNIWILIKSRWSRRIFLFLMYLCLIFVVLGLTFSLIRIEETHRLLVVTVSLLFSGGYVIYSIFVFSSPDAKKIYQKKIFHDEDSSKGWVCPKCSSKMLFSFACWNCGFKKEDHNKPEQVSKKENDKIEKYLKKKTEEEEIGNA